MWSMSVVSLTRRCRRCIHQRTHYTVTQWVCQNDPWSVYTGIKKTQQYLVPGVLKHVYQYNMQLLLKQSSHINTVTLTEKLVTSEY